LLFFRTLAVETADREGVLWPCAYVNFVILCEYMSFFDKTKHTWADKAALLGLLIAGLVIAYFMSVWRSVIKFSEPVELDYMGLCASVPVGNGWEGGRQWVYEENKFVLSSFFGPGQSSPTVVAHCRYLLGAVDVNSRAQIEEKTLVARGTISEQGTLKAGPVGVDWVHMKVPATGARIGFDILFGSAQLPYGRVVNIEVRWSVPNAEKMAEEVFKRMVAGLEFKSSPLLDYGIKILDRMKAKGLGQFITEQNKQSYFVIKDGKGQPAGYVINILADLGSRIPMNIQAGSSFYLRGRRGQEEVIIFQCRDDLSEFVYKNETASRFGRIGIEGVFDRAGVLAVREYGTFILGKGFEETTAEPFEEQFYRPGAASIPDVLAELVYGELLASEYERILIDVIRADGTIVPVVISRADDDNRAEKKSTYAYKLRLDFLDQQDSYSQVYLDENEMIFKETLRRGATYVLERSNPAELGRVFPEKSSEILKYEE